MPRPRGMKLTGTGLKLTAKVKKSPQASTSAVRQGVQTAPDYHAPIAAVFIGDGSSSGRVTFAVHRSILATKSEYFRAALAWPGCDGTVTITDIDGKLFACFVQWLYTGKIFSRVESSVSKGEDMEYEKDEEWDLLIGLYIMGDRLVAPRFKDDLIDAMVEKEVEDETIPMEAAVVYANTKPGSPLRRLLVDFHVYSYRDQTLEQEVAAEYDDEAPKEFYQDVVAAMIKAGQGLYKTKSFPWIEDLPAYHECQGEI